MKRNPFTNHRRPAFTLIELLVVITIVVLLLSILLPSLNAARYISRKTVSMNQMRQTSMLCMYYAADFHEYVPNSPRQDQGSSFWANFYIIVYSSNLVGNTMGYTINAYVTDPRIFMAPNHLDHLRNTMLAADPTHFYGDFGACLTSTPQPYNPTWTAPNGRYLYTSYSYLPWLGFLAYPAGPTIRTSDNVPYVLYYSSGGVSFSNTVLLCETVATPTCENQLTISGSVPNQFKSVNYLNGIAEGGNVAFGDCSVKWAPRSAYVGAVTDTFQQGGYASYNYDIIYRK